MKKEEKKHAIYNQIREREREVDHLLSFDFLKSKIPTKEKKKLILMIIYKITYIIIIKMFSGGEFRLVGTDEQLLLVLLV